MRVLFIHDGIPLTGDARKKGPLGGTETALIGVTQELAKIPDCEVFLCTNIQQAQTYDDVHYFPINQLKSWSENHEVDILISIRQWFPFWLPIRAKHRIYFSPDAPDQPFLNTALSINANIQGQELTLDVFKPEDFFHCIDEFFCVGHWQAQGLVSKLGYPEDKIFVTGNGVFPDEFQPLPLDQRRLSLIYSSTPFRGLEYMVGFYEKLKSSFPHLEFDVCSGLKVYGHSEDQYQGLYEQLKVQGASYHGSVKQQDLLRIMASSRVFSYPNTFAETFCISVLEAQASGLPVVTSKLGALLERIEHGVDGFLIAGHPTDESYQREFLEITGKLLKDSEFWNKISRAALKTAENQTYERLAASWYQKLSKNNIISKAYRISTYPPLRARMLNLPGEDQRQMSLDRHSVVHFVGQMFQRYGFEGPK